MINFDLKKLKIGQAVLLKRWSPDKYDLLMIKLDENCVLGKGLQRDGRPSSSRSVAINPPYKFGTEGKTECYEYTILDNYFESLLSIISTANELGNK